MSGITHFSDNPLAIELDPHYFSTFLPNPKTLTFTYTPPPLLSTTSPKMEKGTVPFSPQKDFFALLGLKLATVKPQEQRPVHAMGSFSEVEAFTKARTAAVDVVLDNRPVTTREAKVA